MKRLCVFLVSCLIGLSGWAKDDLSMRRDTTGLNGKWQIIVDPFDRGEKNGFWKNLVPATPYDILEHGFTDKNTLNVPGDWNSQSPELKYYEGSIWYKKGFTCKPQKGRSVFLRFEAAANYASVFLNGHKLGEHEGGFSPFQFDITGFLSGNGQNILIVRVNNERSADAIPALEFDWWNYGGLTRDVKLISTSGLHIADYFVQLKKGTLDQVEGWVKLSKPERRKVNITINGLTGSHSVESGEDGVAHFSFKKNVVLWSPKNPQVYHVSITTETDSLYDQIGFRSIETRGTDIILNGSPVFLKGVNVHEEMPGERRRAWSEQDAAVLVGWAKELGCNFIRLAHYPHNEHIIKLAERSGLMIWEEIPLWGNIGFSEPVILNKAKNMLKDMIERDKNRCGVIIWSLSNETQPSVERNKVLADMAVYARQLDPTRMISSAFDKFKQEGTTITVEDPVGNVLDVIAVNRYQGWYQQWPGARGDIKWESKYNKPVIVTEFGGEAVYGVHGGVDSVNWSEEHQEQIFKDNIVMFRKMNLLQGVCPWVLVDFRSARRLQPQFQDGWNRKGLLSEKGEKKKAWYIMKEYFDQK